MTETGSTTAPITDTGAIRALSPRAKGFALACLILGMAMAMLDVTIVNVALPTLQQHLDPSGPVDESILSWIISGYSLAGGLVLISFMLLYQTRLYALIDVYSAQSFVLSLSVAWQAYVQGQPHMYITAAIAFLFKTIIIPVALHRIIARLGVHRDVENVVGIGPTMLGGLALVALSVVLMLRIAGDADALAREDLAFALSVVLLGLLIMVTRRNAVSQVVGFMSLENGLVLAATGAKGMPLVVEISIAFSVLIAFIVIGIFLFRIRERFDTVDIQALDRFRGEQR